MAKLNMELKLYIVRALAVYNTPTEVLALIKDDFGITDLKPQNIEAYNPTVRAGKDLSQKLRDEFFETRKEFNDAPKNIPISNLAYRQMRRQKLIDGPLGKNPKVLNEALEQAAKDEGGAYTNRKELTGLNGAPIQQESTTTVIATPDQIRETMRKLDETY